MGEPKINPEIIDAVEIKETFELKARLKKASILLGTLWLLMTGFFISESATFELALSQIGIYTASIAVSLILAFVLIWLTKIIFNSSPVRNYLIQPVSFVFHSTFNILEKRIVDPILDGIADYIIKPVASMIWIKLLQPVVSFMRSMSGAAYWCLKIGIGIAVAIAVFNGISSLPVNTLLTIVIILLILKV